MLSAQAIDKEYSNAINKAQNLESDVSGLLTQNQSASSDILRQQARLIKKKFDNNEDITNEDLQILKQYRLEDIRTRALAGDPISSQDISFLQSIKDEKQTIPQTQTGSADKGYLEPALIKADKNFALEFGKIKPIADARGDDGVTIAEKLIRKHYEKLGYTPKKEESGWAIVDDQGQTHELPGSNLLEDIKRFGTSAAGGLLPALIPGGGPIPILAKAGLTAARIAASGGIEGIISGTQTKDAINQAKKLGLINSNEAKSIGSEEVLPAAKTGALAGAVGQGILGEALPAIPGALKGAGRFFERVGTRGSTETAAKQAIQEAYITNKLLEESGQNPYQGAKIIQNAVNRAVEQNRIGATGYFDQARNAALKATPKDLADVSSWWQEFTDKIADQDPALRDSITNQVAESLGINQPKTELDLITGQKTNFQKINSHQYLDGYIKLSKLADEFESTNRDLYNTLVEAKMAFQRPLVKANPQNHLITEVLEEGAAPATKIGFTTFKNSPVLPEGKATTPYIKIKQGFQELEDGYSAIPVNLRTKVKGNLEDVNNRLFNATFKGTSKQKIDQEDAVRLNRVIGNLYGEKAPEAYKQISDSVVNQAVYRTPTEPVIGGIEGSKVTPDILEKASAMTPAQQKALQAQGVKLDVLKDQQDLIGTGTQFSGKKLLTMSERNKDTLESLVGKENFQQSQKPIQDLMKIQEGKAESGTTMGKLRNLFVDSGGQQTMVSDTALGAGAGGLLGAGIGMATPLPASYTSAAGAAVGGLLGSQVRPAARMAGDILQNIPAETIDQFSQSALGKGLGALTTGTGIATQTNPEETQNILQQILKTKRFTRGNY